VAEARPPAWAPGSARNELVSTSSVMELGAFSGTPTRSRVPGVFPASRPRPRGASASAATSAALPVSSALDVRRLHRLPVWWVFGFARRHTLRRGLAFWLVGTGALKLRDAKAWGTGRGRAGHRAALAKRVWAHLAIACRRASAFRRGVTGQWPLLHGGASRWGRPGGSGRRPTFPVGLPASFRRATTQARRRPPLADRPEKQAATWPLRG
jgi:hypothetical protein